MSRYVSYRSAQGTRAAATGIGSRPVTWATRAEVQRNSLQDDARILAERGLTHGDIASTLGVTRRTVIRWLS